MATSTLGFSYSEASSSGDPLPLTNIQFQPNHSQEMHDMVGFHPNHHFIKSQHHWNNNTNIPHQNQNQNQNQNRFLGEEDPSLSFVPPNDQRPRPIQGRALSLALTSSSNPSRIKLQSFEFRPPDESRFDPSTSVNYQHQQPQAIQQGLLQMRCSRYLSSAQELLNEFCSLDVMKKRPGKGICEENNEEDAMGKQSLYALDRLQLQRRRTKLLHMLEEVNRRYSHYCNRMKGVVSSLETVAGEGAAAVYTSMAWRAMSRHFRCLKDGILKQIKLTKKAMGGDKDGTAVPGATKGETPRLRILDQSLRQQRDFQQLSITESHPWRPQRGLPERSVSVLRSWLFEHFLHPYPSDVDKHILARQTGLSRSQVSNWFINARVRLWKPMVEEMYLQDLKETQPTATATGDHPGPPPLDQNNTSRPIIPDQKPSLEHLIGVVPVPEPDTLSSIITNNNSSTDNSNAHHRFITSPIVIDQYGATIQSGFGDVSLTLGLHHHGGGGLGLGSYSHAAAEAAENPNFYTRDGMEDCQTVQYSLMESENQNLPYRNLMGAQLLHDLAG